MRPYMCKAYQFSFNIEKYFIFLKTTLLSSEYMVDSRIYDTSYTTVDILGRQQAFACNGIHTKYSDDSTGSII